MMHALLLILISCSYQLSGQLDSVKNHLISLQSSIVNLTEHLKAIPLKEGGKQEIPKPLVSPKRVFNYDSLATIWLERNAWLNQKSWWSKPPGKTKMIELFLSDVKRLKKYNTQIPEKSSDFLRIATYNIHAWADANNNSRVNDILQTIETIDADVLVLQEVTTKPYHLDQLKKWLLPYGYSTVTFAPADTRSFGNLIALKKGIKILGHQQGQFKASVDPSSLGDKRSFIQYVIEYKGNPFSIYGTHFEVRDEQVAQKQMTELIDRIKSENYKYVFIAADFNSVRAIDYDFVLENSKINIWRDLFNKKVTHFEPQTKVITSLENTGFKNIYDVARTTNGEPRFTNWAGTMIDAIYSNFYAHYNWYVYYSDASDHLPVIVDFFDNP